MDYKQAVFSEKIRAYAVSLAKESEGLIVDVGLTIDRAVVVALLLAYFDAVRVEWTNWCEANPELKGHIAVAKELMRDAGYGDMDPICGLLGVKPYIAKVDGLEAVSFEHSMVNPMPLSAIFLNKVREVMDAAAKVAAADAAKPEPEKPVE